MAGKRDNAAGPLEHIADASDRQVWVVGDLMVDSYIDGGVSRVSPEAPVPVVAVDREYDRLGGAANVAAGVQALSGKVSLAGIVGNDQAGHRITGLAQGLGIDTTSITETARGTTRKLRVTGEDQQIARLDWEETQAISTNEAQDILAQLRATEDPDAIIISDYGKGVVTSELVAGLAEVAHGRSIPLIVDPKGTDFVKYKGANGLTPNLAEFMGATGNSVDPDSDKQMGEAARKLTELVGLDWLLVTLGAAGMVLWTGPAGLLRISTQAKQVYDVTGAGDTVVATLGLSLAAGAPLEPSVRLANEAAALVIAKSGTSVISPAELTRSVRPGGMHKIASTDELTERIGTWRAEGKKLVFTNGCFDLLHAGHIHILERASELGDVLVVGINDDASVSRLKGETRPLVPLGDRQAVLAALSFVGAVVAFCEDTPVDLIRTIQPDVLVKGGDYTAESVVGADIVEACGGRVEIIDLLPDRSTSNLVSEIRRQVTDGKS